MKTDEIENISKHAREAFLAERKEFRESFKKAVNSL